MKALLLSSLLMFSSVALGECVVVLEGQKSTFDGKSLVGLKVEKKSLAALNAAHRSLNVIQNVFTGKLITCEDCSKDNHVICR